MTSLTTKYLHFLTGVFLHFITGADKCVATSKIIAISSRISSSEISSSARMMSWINDVTEREIT